MLATNKVNITIREKEVLYFIAYECTSREIAAKMHLSVETIRSHRKNLLRKLDVRNIAGLIRKSMEMELIG